MQHAEMSNDDTAFRTVHRTVEIDLKELVQYIWLAKYTLIGACLLAVFLALLSLAFSRKEYTATALLGPAESNSQGGLKSALEQYSGAASMLGVNLGGGAGDSDFAKFKSLLKSERLAEELFKDDSLKVSFFGPGWHPQTHTWSRPPGVVFEIKDFLKGVLGLPRWAPPDPYSLQESLKLHLAIMPDKLTGFVTVSITDTSPQAATHTLRAIVLKADGIIRQTVKDRAAGRIAYLNDQLIRISNADQRQAMITVLSSQQKMMMMTSADRTYAIDIIDPPGASPIQTSPRPSSTVLFYVISLAFVVVAWAVLRGHLVVRAAARREGRYLTPSLDIAVLASLEEWYWRVFGSRSRHQSVVQSTEQIGDQDV